MEQKHSWQGVPQEKRNEWYSIFDASHEGINLSIACPVCGTPTLHRYYQVGRPIERCIEGNRFVAVGASWEWCSTCFCYEHATVLVPDWWSERLQINEQDLTAEPEVLEEAVRRYDRT